MKYNLDYVDSPLLETTYEAVKVNRLHTQKLSFRSIDNGYILPVKSLENKLVGGGVLTNDLIYVLNSSLHEGHGVKYSFTKEEVETIDSDVIYIGYLLDIWGHCLTDNIKKLWFLFSKYGKNLLLNNIKLVYISFDELPENFLQMLECIGITRESLVKVDTVKKYKRIYVPDDSFKIIDNNRVYTLEYENLVEKIIKEIPEKKYSEKIYLTRSKFKSPDFGEKDVEKSFKKAGFKIVSPEKLSFRNLVGIIKGCSTLATTEGSIAHNALFLNKNTNLILVRKAPYINGYQYPINSIRNLNVIVIDSHLSLLYNEKYPWNGPFFIYVNDNLIKFFYEKFSLSFLPKLNLNEFNDYINGFFIQNNIKISNVIISEFYQKIFQAEFYFNKKRIKFLFCKIMAKVPFLSKTCKLKMQNYINARKLRLIANN